jgi:S-methylmethionine-dependent homocysteine/selenocysteine methylase
MTTYRNALPQLEGGLFLSDGGIETTLIFHEGLALPDFAAFDLFKDADGEAALSKYFRTYTNLAARYDTGLILESATRRASADWGARLGYSQEELGTANRKAIAMLVDLRQKFANGRRKAVISGCVGPRGDGYNPPRSCPWRRRQPITARRSASSPRAQPIW